MSKQFLQIGKRIGALVEKKNAAYGSSVMTSVEALKLLYPKGISHKQMSDALLIVRIWDKLQRIATDQDAFGESPYGDIAGYGILGVAMHSKRKVIEGCFIVSGAKTRSGASVRPSAASSAKQAAKRLRTTNGSAMSAKPSKKRSMQPSVRVCRLVVAPARTATGRASKGAVAPAKSAQRKAKKGRGR